MNASRADLRFGTDGQGKVYVLTEQDGMARRLAAIAPADTAIRPVENPLDPLGDSSLWRELVGRLGATFRELADATK